LTASEISEGMNAASSNAQRLAEDASLLLEASRFPTAAALACLSIEEAGKTSILRGVAGITDEKGIKQFWRDYKSHTRKNVLWPSIVLFADGARKLTDFASLFSKHAKHPFVLDQVKQSGFYTDFTHARTWASPEGSVEESLARALVGLAKIMAGSDNHTVHEIELWIKHFESVPRDNLQEMQQAVIGWYESMQKAGLRPDGQNLAAQFITNGLPRGEV
jgi:AbiV family abortive infection protein